MQFPRWLSWIVLIGLGWIVFVGNTTPRHPIAPAPEPAVEAPQTSEHPQLQALLDGERWKKAINPDYKSPDEACAPSKRPPDTLADYAIIEAEGTGDEAVCGDAISLTWARWGNDGKPGKPTDATLTLGAQPGLDALLVGMRPGERRLVLVRLPERVKTLPQLPPKNQLVLEVTRRP